MTAPAIVSTIAEHRAASRRAERAAAGERSRRAPATSRPAPSTPAPERPSATSRKRGRRDQDDRAGRRPPAAAVGPEREVEQDAGAAREREQREHEADEGRVDAERRRDPATDAGEHAVVARCARSGSAEHLVHRGAHHVDPAGADVRVDHERCPGRRGRRGVRAVVVAPEARRSSPAFACAFDGDVGVLRGR